MKDKETIKKFVNKVWKENGDSIAYRVEDNMVVDTVERLEFTKKELLRYSTLLAEQLEQEAERRGRVKENERCMKLIGEIIQATSWEAPQQFFDGLRCARSSIELKLLEEENGKQE